MENASLQRECESLRALFIRQQQQQIAFWTGSFMDMVAPKGGQSAAFDKLSKAPTAAFGGFAMDPAESLAAAAAECQRRREFSTPEAAAEGHTARAAGDAGSERSTPSLPSRQCTSSRASTQFSAGGGGGVPGAWASGAASNCSDEATPKPRVV
eukprot:TRINITY_DN50457_c0_g1_i1.p2 TRINITY_DN50457_c0_g1~~TRINITY_DN50457_c0_g1_i1.p2  ORF type:complete len:178 (-),score=50.53 TRINITY_DN50457_c0_g1_i1:177-638(-)